MKKAEDFICSNEYGGPDEVWYDYTERDKKNVEELLSYIKLYGEHNPFFSFRTFFTGDVEVKDVSDNWRIDGAFIVVYPASESKYLEIHERHTGMKVTVTL